MDAKVFVYVAHKDGKADDSALELASAAKTLFPGTAPKLRCAVPLMTAGAPAGAGAIDNPRLPSSSALPL